MVWTLNQETATLTTASRASMALASPVSSWAYTSTKPSAARLPAAAVSTMTSRMARLGSSRVARAAVCSADSDQTASQVHPQKMIAVASHPMVTAYRQSPKIAATTAQAVPMASE